MVQRERTKGGKWERRRGGWMEGGKERERWVGRMHEVVASNGFNYKNDEN